MQLNEYFGRPVNVDSPKERSMELDKDDLFHYILNNDRLFKENFFPVARKIKSIHNKPKFDKKSCVKEFLEMVNRGCREYYEENKMYGKLKDKFPKELREELCEKLFDHYYEDVIKEKYNLGDNFIVGKKKPTVKESDELDSLLKLAGIKNPVKEQINISHTGTEKAKLMREHNIKPGTPEWFKLWFSLPFMTGEKCIDTKAKT